MPIPTPGSLRSPGAILSGPLPGPIIRGPRTPRQGRQDRKGRPGRGDRTGRGRPGRGDRNCCSFERFPIRYPEESNTMTSTHLSLHYHLIFSTKGRLPWIKVSWEKRLHEYLGGIIRGLGGVAEEIGTSADHAHILISLNATRCLAEIIREIKASSSAWIHRTIRIRLFSWQDGYGAFTVSRSDAASIKRYIRGQREHHRKRSFQDEYLHLLRQNGIEFDERYLW